MEHVKQAKWASIFSSAVMIALGVVLLAWPLRSDTQLCRILGAVLGLQGVIKLYGYFSHDRFGLAYQFDFALGIFSLTAAFFMLLYPEKAIAAPPMVLGVSLFIDGVFKLQTTIDAKKFGLERWWTILILAIITCGCGLCLLLRPLNGASSMTMTLGAALCVYGLQNLSIIIYTVRAKTPVMKEESPC